MNLITVEIYRMTDNDKDSCAKLLTEFGWAYVGKDTRLTGAYAPNLTAAKTIYEWTKDTEPVIPDEFADYIF